MLAKVVLLALVCKIASGSHFHEDKHSAPQPYRFGYEVKDKEGSQYRHEEGDGHGSVKGSYGYTDDKGIYREVHYVADKGGFRAKVKTNEPGTSNQDPAHVEVQSTAKHHDFHHASHTPVYHKAEVFPAHHEAHHLKHVPVYHKPEVTHNYHKVHVEPIKPFHHFQNHRSYDFNNFSPIHRYSYRPSSFFRYGSDLSNDNGFRYNLGRQIGGHNINVPHQHNNLGFSGFNNGFENFSGHNNGEIQKLIEEAKKHRNLGHNQGFSSLGGFDNIGGLDNLSGFNGFSNDGVDKIIEELKHKNSHTYSGKHGNFHGNNDFHIKEFRNIGNHKYSRSSDSKY